MHDMQLMMPAYYYSLGIMVGGVVGGGRGGRCMILKLFPYY